MIFDDNAMTILKKRYLWPNETPDGMFRRVADYIGSAETQSVKDQFFEIMNRGEFLPNSPTLMNAGKPKAQLAACFVLPIEDSMESIMAAATAQAMIFKSGGGCIGGESTLLTEKGPVDLKTFCDEQRQDRVLSFDPDTKTMQYRQVSAHHITPLPASRIYEVKMSGRCSVRASDWHPFFVWNGERIEERRADQLRKGDVVIGSTMMSEATAPDWGAWLIGLILSDGAFDFTSSSLKYQYRRLRIAKSYESVIARAAEVMGCNYSLSCNPAYQTPVWELTVSGKKAEVLFESFGRDDVRCSNKRIPEWVWTSGASTMLHLLIGLLDGDGWYCNNKHGFFYDTISEGLAQDVMALCGCLGISASMRRRVPRRTNEQPIYEIHMRANASLIEAADRLSTRHAGHITGHKQFAIPVSLEYDKRLKEHYGVDFWKTDWWHNGIPMNRGKINILRWHHDGLLPINSAAMLLREIGEKELAAALDSAHVVKSVSISEKDDTLYDLTVPGTQTYVAGVNGFCVVHNTGFNFSKLRAEGSPINNSIGTASGPVSFMELYDKVTDVVKAGGGRRGANMGILNCDHPDLEAFINAKGSGRLTNFNISIMATDEWMKRAEAGEEPLFERAVEQAWKTGDPGMLFYDAINMFNPTPHLGNIEATNPCVTGDTMILTDAGYKRIGDLVDTPVRIWNGQEWSEVTPRITGENQPIMEISFSDGSTLKCTPYHKFLVQEGFSRDGKVFEAKAEELRPGMRIAKFKFPVIPGVSSGMSESEAYINGFYSGDGYWDKAKKQHVIFVYGKKRILTKYLCENARRIGGSAGNRDMLVADPDVMHEKFWVPGTECSVSERLAWLAGLIDSDGSKNSIDCSVNITSTNHDFLMKVKRMINTLGENATIAKTHDAQTKSMPDGHGGIKEYDCQACYRLLINASTIERLKHLGLNLRRVDVNHAIDRDASRFIKVTGVRLLERRERYVYCFNEPKRHMGIFNGVLTFQCGESPLYPYEACNLGSINIAAFVRDGKIDYDRLDEVVRVAVRFLDDVIEMNTYPLPEIREAALRTRKIGLGIMGWADALIKLRIRYGSQESVYLAKSLWGKVRNIAADESATLGHERGVYPACMGAYRRNATLTCIAPTGTISLIAGVSSGIEPVFSFRHTRMAFAGTQALEYVHPLYEQAQREGWYDPEVFVSAHEVSVPEQIAMQATFQENTDLAVSKTINLPNSATVEDVRKAYLLAWKQCCKGITVYRDGCLESQVLIADGPNGKAQGKPQKRGLPYRREEGVLDGKTSKMPTAFGNLYVTLNTLSDGTPVEAFATVGKSGADMESNTEAIGRLMSLALRYGAPVSEIIDQLKGISGAQPVWDHDGKSILSIPDGIARCLEQITGEVREVSAGLVCPDCGGMTVREEGCVKCPACGWSRC